MKILAAMSGGVDSSVVAHLLKQQGHDVIGVMMKLWSDPLAPVVRKAVPTKCCSLEHIARARSVCAQLDIPFYVLNLEQEFKANVVDPFLKEYAEGRTPNPCIECNRNIKFGSLLKKMQELGCDRLATGHYARVAQERRSDGSIRHVLLEAEDETKDQSYYLYGLSQEQLSRVLFPLGGLRKSETFALAELAGVPIQEHYRESQDLCFFPEKEPSAFLRRYLCDVPEGPIKLMDDTPVGTHAGLPFYTIGQRKGLGIGGLKIPLHVVRKERKSNTIFVAPVGSGLVDSIHVSNVRWVSWKPPENVEVSMEARIRSLGKRYAGTARVNDTNLVFRMHKGLSGVASGQSLVLYRGKEVVGGGVIR